MTKTDSKQAPSSGYRDKLNLQCARSVSWLEHTSGTRAYVLVVYETALPGRYSSDQAQA